ncbi:MAG: VOC family protein [Clostridium sp.]|jgi:uncharacterized glyoxalase superfamily protein PhnB|nr:VOC family protein [Clostridium sp.]
MNRVNIICLGVKNMEESIKFYRDGLGFKTDEVKNSPNVIFFNTTGAKLELFPLDLLAKDINEEDPPVLTSGFSGITLAYNVREKEEVLEIIELARKSGAVVVKEPQNVFWGGYHGYFKDPNGYYWEVAWGPNFIFDENDMLIF